MSTINLILYAFFLTGVLLFSGRDIRDYIKSVSVRNRLGKGLGKAEERSRTYKWFQLLLSANTTKNEVDTGSFINLLVMVFILIFLLCLKSLNIIVSLLISLAISSLPILFLYARMESSRTKNSKEGISLVTEFYRQYRMKNLNVYEALEATVSAEGDFPGCRKQLYRLLLKLRSSSGDSDIKHALDDFSFALGTVWGKMFTTCIGLAAERGDDVSEGLADIISQLKTAEIIAEDRKRLNGEAARMTMYLVPILYIGTMLLAVYYLDVSPARLMKNQFFTAEGLIFFLGTLFLFVLNLVLLKLIDNTRIDY